MHYTQLTEGKRYQFYTLLGNGFTQAEAAQQIGVHPSTVGRELARNSGDRGYRPKQANRKALARREEANKTCRMTKYIQKFLR